MAKILVVDDDNNIAELIGHLMESEGHSVTIARDGQSCLDHAMLEKPDLILLDVMMPVMDGFTVAARLLSEDGTRDIPVLVLTAKSQMKDAFAMSSNVVDYIEKPFEPALLRDRVEQILSR